MASLTLSPALIVAISTHARNLAKVAEVMGCAKAKPKTAAVSASLTFKGAAAAPCLSFKGSDGSELDLPLQAIADIGTEALSLMMGLDATAPAGDGDKQLRAALAEAEREGRQLASDVAKLKEALADQVAQAAARLAEQRKERAAAQAVLARVRQEAPALASAAKVTAHDAGDLLGSIVEATEGPAPVQVASVAAAVQVAPAAVQVATLPEGDAILADILARPDVEVERLAGRVVLVTFTGGRQGLGVADKLKACGFRFRARGERGALVWARR